jgi:internalin A
MQRLRFLRIYRSPITDEGLASLAANHRIEELGLPETLITDAGLAYLKSMSTVRWLDLYNTAVTKGAVNSLRAVNPDLEITYIAEAPELADLKTKIDDVKAGKTTYFAIAGWKIQDRHLSELGEFTGIESLALNAHHLTDATLAHVELLERLKELDISSSLITGRGLRHLLKLPKLRTLTLDDRQIDDEAINALKQLPALKELWVKCDVGDADLKRLEARMNAAFANDPTVKRHFDRQSDSHSPWD